MHRFQTPQSSIQNKYMHISVLIGALRDVEGVHSAICELGQICSDQLLQRFM